MIKSIKDQSIHPAPAAEPETHALEYLPGPEETRPRFGERLSRNLALAGMLIITVAALRNAQLPTGQTVLTAVRHMIDDHWEENIGKISFVSNLFPETVSVFFQSAPAASLTLPCFQASLVHPWSGDEPYLGFASSNGSAVYAVSSGQVMSVAHGPEEEKIIRLRHEDGLESMYYNLLTVAVREGDAVTASTKLGEAIPGASIAVEVRRAGLPIDPTALFSPRNEAEK